MSSLFRTNTAQATGPSYALTSRQMLALVAMMGTLFQIGHFAEHAAQFGTWVFFERSRPWMSDIAEYLTHALGMLAVPSSELCLSAASLQARQMAVGMELLHLCGNTIFLATLACFCMLIPSRVMRWAFWIELFHLAEHLMLTASVFLLWKPLGMSTLFGQGQELLGMEYGVGYRVAWHFILNLVPTVLMTVGMVRAMQRPVYDAA